MPLTVAFDYFYLQNAPKPKYQIHIKSTSTPIYVMLVDSDEHINAAAALPRKELIESAKEDSSQVSEKLEKKEIEVKETKKVPS